MRERVFSDGFSEQIKYNLTYPANAQTMSLFCREKEQQQKKTTTTTKMFEQTIFIIR